MTKKRKPVRRARTRKPTPKPSSLFDGRVSSVIGRALTDVPAGSLVTLAGQSFNRFVTESPVPILPTPEFRLGEAVKEAVANAITRLVNERLLQ